MHGYLCVYYNFRVMHLFAELDMDWIGFKKMDPCTTLGRCTITQPTPCGNLRTPVLRPIGQKPYFFLPYAIHFRHNDDFFIWSWCNHERPQNHYAVRIFIISYSIERFSGASVSGKGISEMVGNKNHRVSEVLTDRYRIFPYTEIENQRTFGLRRSVSSKSLSPGFLRCRYTAVSYCVPSTGTLW